MLDHGRVWLAALYAAGSIAAGLVGFAIGTNLVRQARFSW